MKVAQGFGPGFAIGEIGLSRAEAIEISIVAPRLDEVPAISDPGLKPWAILKRHYGRAALAFRSGLARLT